MKIFTLTLILLGLSIFLFGGCSTQTTPKTKNEMEKTISEIATLSNLKFPQGSEIIFDAEETLSRENFDQWVIASPNKIELPEETWEGGSEATLALMKDVLPNKDLGTPKGKTSTLSSWENESGKWQAKMVETDKGFYLLLEVFK